MHASPQAEVEEMSHVARQRADAVMEQSCFMELRYVELQKRVDEEKE